MATTPEHSRKPHDVIVIAGITGTGKTALSLALAEQFATLGRRVEIINGDAMQFYRGMDIGTAKLSLAERALVPHHLFDFLEVTETATVADFQMRARTLIEQIQDRQATPILVGGSGLYLSAVLQDFTFPPQDPALRQRLERQAETPEGAVAVVQQLNELDPVSAASINHSNIRRIIRALEVVLLTGEPYSGSLPEHAPHWQNATQFFLDGDREVIRQRLLSRATEMFANGLVEETRQLLARGLERGSTAKRAIGYAQAMAVLDGTLTEAEAIEETWRLTTRYARRQRSWFNRYDDIVRLDFMQPNLLDEVMNILHRAETISH